MSEISFFVRICISFKLSKAQVISAAVNVESEGPYAPERLFPESIRIMREKIANLRKTAEALNEQISAGDGDGDVSMVDV